MPGSRRPGTGRQAERIGAALGSRPSQPTSQHFIDDVPEREVIGRRLLPQPPHDVVLDRQFGSHLHHDALLRSHG